MFNKSFDLTAFVANQPLAIRKQMLLSLVGSVNASIVGAADRVALSLVADGYTFEELRELEPREIDELLSTVDFQGNVTADYVRKLVAVGHDWRAMLQSTQSMREGNLGDITSTIEMMVGVQRMRPVDDNAVKLLAAVGVTVDASTIEATRKARRDADQQRADQRALRRGFIEWAIEHCFTLINDRDDETDAYGDLPSDYKEQLCNKAAAALNKGITTATQNVLMGNRNPDALGLGDIPMLQAAHAQLLSAMYEVKTVEAPAALPDAPTKRARRVKKTLNAEDSQKLANALHELSK